MKYAKLVRDKIPRIIEERGETARYYIADAEEYVEELKEKLLEEVNEFLENEEVEELADILEVMDAICVVKNIPLEDVVDIKEKKAEQRGRFEERIMLEF